jgi:hypothetical protein
MERKTWQALWAVLLGLILLTLTVQVGRAQTSRCCVCNQCSSFRCTTVSDVDAGACDTFCATVNSTSCGVEVVNSSCAEVQECGTVGAPLLGTNGLTAVTVLLVGLGFLGLQRAAQRTRR